MWRIKRLLDPDRILNPGVVLNEDPKAHVTHLKPSPTISPLADRCIECGYCEARCPSRDLTLSPRQRIVLTGSRRTLAASPDPEDRALARAIAADFATTASPPAPGTRCARPRARSASTPAP